MLAFESGKGMTYKDAGFGLVTGFIVSLQVTTNYSH
jgi:hypothetical protein